MILILSLLVYNRETLSSLIIRWVRGLLPSPCCFCTSPESEQSLIAPPVVARIKHWARYLSHMHWPCRQLCCYPTAHQVSDAQRHRTSSNQCCQARQRQPYNWGSRKWGHKTSPWEQGAFANSRQQLSLPCPSISMCLTRAALANWQPGTVAPARAPCFSCWSPWQLLCLTYSVWSGSLCLWHFTAPHLPRFRGCNDAVLSSHYYLRSCSAVCELLCWAVWSQKRSSRLGLHSCCWALDAYFQTHDCGCSGWEGTWGPLQSPHP